MGCLWNGGRVGGGVYLAYANGVARQNIPLGFGLALAGSYYIP